MVLLGHTKLKTFFSGGGGGGGGGGASPILRASSKNILPHKEMNIPIRAKTVATPTPI